MVSFTSIITPSLALIGSLAWNEFFKSSIKIISPIDTSTGAVVANFLYAVFVSILVLLVYYLYIRVAEKVNGEKAAEYGVVKAVLIGVDNKTVKLIKKIVADTSKEKDEQDKKIDKFTF